MSSTAALRRQAKEALQKLREKYLRAAADPVEEKRIAAMIKRQKELLEELGG